jgi:chemotaxis methyl-accepting protein methylase
VSDDADREFSALTAKIAREKGFGCASYKEKCLRRRIAVRMRARGVHTYGDYARVLDSDSTEYERLLDALTINVTKLFRNWETYDIIAKRVVPSLWQRESALIKVWSAGCSSGEEPYSLAALFIATPSRSGNSPICRIACVCWGATLTLVASSTPSVVDSRNPTLPIRRPTFGSDTSRRRHRSRSCPR